MGDILILYMIGIAVFPVVILRFGIPVFLRMHFAGNCVWLCVHSVFGSL